MSITVEPKRQPQPTPAEPAPPEPAPLEPGELEQALLSVASPEPAAPEMAPAVIETGQPPVLNIGYWGDGAVTAREAQMTFVRQLADRLPDLRGRRVLDVGCRVGGAATILAREYGADVDAINSSVEQVEQGRRFTAALGLESRVRFHIAGATELPFEDESFDIVFSLESAQRLTDKPGFVREAYRVLRPGGNIALSDEVTTLNLPVARRRPALDVDLVTARAWRQMVAEAGFEVLEHQLVGSSVYPGYRRWLMLTASERRRAILDSLSESGDARRPEALRHAQAWLREFTAHRSRSALTGAIHLREYLILVARRPAL